MNFKLKAMTGLLGLSLLSAPALHVQAQETGWVARTVEQIQADIQYGDTYTIQYGDTLSAISLATDIPMEHLASINNIENKDLILTGAELRFSTDRNKITVIEEATQTEKEYTFEDNSDTIQVKEKQADGTETSYEAQKDTSTVVTDIDEETPAEVLEAPQEPVNEPQEPIQESAVEEEPTEQSEPVEQPTPTPEVQSTQSGTSLGTFRVTSYAVGDGMTPSTVTANGTNVANTIYSPEGYRIIAVDTNVIPMNSVVRVTLNGQTFLAKASDTGSAINGNIIDLLVSSPQEAHANGIQSATVEIVN